MSKCPKILNLTSIESFGKMSGSTKKCLTLFLPEKTMCNSIV